MFINLNAHILISLGLVFCIDVGEQVRHLPFPDLVLLRRGCGQVQLERDVGLPIGVRFLEPTPPAPKPNLGAGAEIGDVLHVRPISANNPFRHEKVAAFSDTYYKSAHIFNWTDNRSFGLLLTLLRFFFPPLLVLV